MNAKELLTILDDDFSDANVEMAIAWLKTKQPTNKSADKVMQIIFEHPKTHIDLTWLSNWFQHGNWDCLIHGVLRVETIELFDWHLELLRSNPDHPQANWLWLNLLQEFRNVEVGIGAIEWLRYKKFEDDIADLILANLLDRGPTPELIEKAKEAVTKKPEFSLVSSLMKNVSDAFSISAGASILKQDIHPALKLIVAEAMADADLEANKEHILEFLMNKDYQDYAIRLLSEIGERNAKHLSFICDFIERADTRTTKVFLKKTRMIFVNDDAANTLWFWFKNGERSDKRFEIFIQMFETSWCALPDEAKDYVADWIDKNPKHKLKKSAGVVLAREHNSFNSRLPGAAYNDVSGGLVSTFILKANEIDEKSLKSVREWMKSFPITQDNVSAIVKVYKITGDRQDLEPLIALLDKGNSSFKSYLLSELAHLDISELFEITLDHLAERRLYKGWSSRKVVGNLILELLKVRPKHEQVLNQAKEWLKVRPNDYEHSAYKQILDAVKKAEYQY